MKAWVLSLVSKLRFQQAMWHGQRKKHKLFLKLKTEARKTSKGPGSVWWGLVQREAEGWQRARTVSSSSTSQLLSPSPRHPLSALGLQASPSKHAGYSVRMENAVPIVTQAPGAQPLQIQPGLLAQVILSLLSLLLPRSMLMLFTKETYLW